MLPAIKTDVCIVGGGPAGLSTAHAILRARPDARVAVMERSDLRPRGAWFGITPNGVRAMEAIDPQLRERLAAHNTKHMVQQRFSATGDLISSTDKGDQAARVLEYGDIYYLQWSVLQHELADALPEGVLHPCHRFVDYSETADGVSVQFEGPDGPAAVEASLLVGCDGSQSLVREQLLGDGPPKYLGMAIWRAVRPRPADWLVEHGSVSWGGPGQPSLMTATFGNGNISWQGFAPWPADKLHVIGGGRRAYFSSEADPTEQAGREARQTAEEAGVERRARAQAAFKGHPQIVQDLIASTDPAAITEHGQFYREEADCQVYARGRVALVGDAAHLATPFLGQGASQAIEDALELGRAVGVHGASPEALAAYQAVRLPQAGAVQRESVQLCKEFHAGNMSRHEYDVNIDCGFVKRTHTPLVPATVAA